MAEIDKLEGILVGFEKTVEKLDKVLFGNERPGVIERLARVEDNMIKLSEAMLATNTVTHDDIDELKKVVENLAKSVNTLREVAEANQKEVETHIKNKEVHSLKGLVLHKDSLLYIVVGYLVLHSLMPTSFNVADAILHILGVQ